MSDGLLRNKNMSTNMIVPPIIPIDQKAVRHSTVASNVPTVIAITAGPKPWEACKRPIPNPNLFLNQ